jgi:hypothetical protein
MIEPFNKILFVILLSSDEKRGRDYFLLISFSSRWSIDCLDTHSHVCVRVRSVFQVSISPTFYVQLLHSKVTQEAFCTCSCVILAKMVEPCHVLR